MESIAKLFQNGRSQAVRLPKAFRFNGSEVKIRKEGDKKDLHLRSSDAVSLRGNALKAMVLFSLHNRP